MRYTRLTTGWVALLCTSALFAQHDDRRERIERELLEKQRQMREGRVVLANVRVTVRLANGSRLRGVVRHGRFIERLDELDFIKTDQRGPDAGLRLWYYDNTNSYIFLPYDSIKNYTIGEKLTDIEVADIAKRIEESRLAADAARLGEPSAKNDATRGATDDPNASGGTAVGDAPSSESNETTNEGSATDDPLTAEQRGLLAEFPPEDGWGEDRVRSIQTRQTTVGVYPSPAEKRFLEVFSAWQEAHELRAAGAAAPATDLPVTSQPRTGSGVRLPGKDAEPATGATPPARAGTKPPPAPAPSPPAPNRAVN